MAPSDDTSTEPLGKFVLQISTTLASADPEALTPKDTLPDTWRKSRWTSGCTVAWPIRSFMPRRGVTILEGVTDPGHQCHRVTMAMSMHWHSALLSEWLGAAQGRPQCKSSGDCKRLWPVLLPTAGELSGVSWGGSSLSLSAIHKEGWGLSDGCRPCTWRNKPLILKEDPGNKPNILYSPFPATFESTFLFSLTRFLIFYFSITVNIQCYCILVSGYSIVGRCLHDLWSDAPEWSSINLAPHIVITILLTIIPMLFFASPWLFFNYQFVLLNPFTLFTQPCNATPMWQPSVCSLHPRVFLLCLLLYFVL